MDIIYSWSTEFAGLESLPSDIYANYSKLVEIVEAVENCIGHEFAEDEESFEQKYGRPPNRDERPSMHPPFYTYEHMRKSRFVNCVKQNTRNLLQLDDTCQSQHCFPDLAGMFNDLEGNFGGNTDRPKYF